MNHNEFYEQVNKPDSDRFADKPHGWIQWKSTDACIDLHCICGAHGHIDAEFFYHYECAKCHRKYAVGMNVALIELTPEQAAFVPGNLCDFMTDESVLDDDDTADGDEKQ